ncbi:MAG: hypothetical protein AAFP78_02850 [Pseudomonadota bacterium]
MKRLVLALIAFALLATPLLAGDAQIVDARAQKNGPTWSFSVTIAHGDTGWDHYADAWRVVTPSGEVLGTRTLHHPHVEEQPFTRSLSGVAIPREVTEVLIEARDSVHGWSPKTFPIKLR